MAVDFQEPPPGVDQVVSQYTRSAESMGLPNVAQQARLQAIRDSGKSIGIQAGINSQLYAFSKALQKHERDFDTIYDFGRLMIKGRVVPPVISEVRDIYTQNDDFALTISGVSYKIESQARFSSTPPSWRSYLNFGRGNTDFTQQIMGLGLENNESASFQRAIRDGFNEGIEQANQMVSHGFDRLNRDYTGMLRFDTFVRQGKISMPVIASAEIPITQSGDTMTLDETLLRLTVLSSFNSDMDKWRTWVTPSSLYQRIEGVPKLETDEQRKNEIAKEQQNLGEMGTDSEAIPNTRSAWSGGKK